jgi:hypothetical protein
VHPRLYSEQRVKHDSATWSDRFRTLFRACDVGSRRLASRIADL